MAVFYQGRPITLGTLGLLRSDTPLTVGVDGVLEPLFITVTPDIVLGGSAGVTTSLGYTSAGIIITGGTTPITVAIGGNFDYQYQPSVPNPITVLGDALIVARTNGVLTVDYTPLGGIVTGGTAAVTFEDNFNRHIGTGGIILDGTAPVITFINGKLTYTYPPALGESLVTGGDALVVAETAGKLTVIYKPSFSTSVNLSGQSNVGTTIGGNTTEDYYALGGLVANGSALVVFTPIEIERGGKGTPMFRRTKPVQKSVFYYTAEALRERRYYDTDFGYVLKGKGSVVLTGAADLLFIPAKFQFIKSLPRLPKPELVPDSEFKQLYQELLRRHPTQSYSYVADGGIAMSGKSEEDYFDFENFIITHDDELIIADIMSTEGNPFLTTKYDLSLESRRRDDDELLEVLEIF